LDVIKKSLLALDFENRHAILFDLTKLIEGLYISGPGLSVSTPVKPSLGGFLFGIELFYFLIGYPSACIASRIIIRF
jgi:hypothetical protein